MLTRILLTVCLAAGLAACATDHGGDKFASATQAVTPTEQYPLRATHGPEDLLLAIHDAGVSANQVSALDDLVARWRDAGADKLVIKAPSAGGDRAYRMVAAVERRLTAVGVDPAAIEVAGYDPGSAGSAGPAPVVVGFERYQAAVPKCNRDWTSVTNTAENGVDPNFGCAVSANMAAMIANPEDIDHPATMTDIDAARREAVLSKYRAGATTSTAKDDQANGAVSTAVQ